MTWVQDVEDPNDVMLTTTQAAELTPFKESTFLKWRLTWTKPDGACLGPKPQWAGRRVFYRRGDVKDWLTSYIEANGQ